jgi:hypothetical protein
VGKINLRDARRFLAVTMKVTMVVEIRFGEAGVSKPVVQSMTPPFNLARLYPPVGNVEDHRLGNILPEDPEDE